MTDLPLIVAGGLLGSAHCIGMCGGFALTLGSAAPTWRMNLVRQTVFGCGRTFTYVALGAIAGFSGQRLVQLAPFARVQSWLAVAAGVFLLWQGVAATGWLPRRKTQAGKAACLRPGILPTLLRLRGVAAAVAAGVLTGLLPCGLVYAFLSYALSSGSMLRGMAIMACFGLGTLPLLTLFGLGMSLVGLALRQRMLQAAAWCVVLTGALSLMRGVGTLTASNQTAEASFACPLCAERADEGNSRIENMAAAVTIPTTVSTTISKPTP